MSYTRSDLLNVYMTSVRYGMTIIKKPDALSLGDRKAERKQFQRAVFEAASEFFNATLNELDREIRKREKKKKKARG